MYLEGSDQHRGWFQSSLLESCGTRGRAPFDVVLTHGFVLDENGRKMSKSLGNVTAPQDVIKQSGADILRLWVLRLRLCRRPAHRPGNPQDHRRDLPQAPQHPALDARLARAFPRRGPRRAGEMPELERLMLHRLAELDGLVRQAYADFDYKRIFAALNAFMTSDLSAFYFDIRKDALYCDPISSTDAQGLPDRDRPAVPRHRDLARADAAVHRRGGVARALPVRRTARCISRLFPGVPAAWRDDALAEKWRKVRTGAPRRHRRARDRAGAEAHRLLARSRARHLRRPTPTCSPRSSTSTWRRSRITSAATLVEGEGPADAFRLDEVKGVAVEVRLAAGRKCARSWKILPSVGSDPDYPDVTPRDAQALREWEAMRSRRRMTVREVAPFRDHASGRGVNGPMLWGPLTRFGLVVAAAAAALDQAVKLWLLFVFDLGGRGLVTLTPFLDLVLTWNTGISYGLFQQEGPLGQWAAAGAQGHRGRSAVDLAGAGADAAHRAVLSA